ncbi:MAG: internal scaffolding protein [Microviridae sp.]|nr:MAG: internal scaffolding protein [Microviridae sp.]
MNVRIVGLYESDELSAATALRCEDESLTHQEFREESDINTIIDRFGIGENPIEAQKWVTNVDIANAPDNYMDVMNQLNVAREQFMTLPAKVRSTFDNDPSRFVDFVSDPGNGEELVRMGLAVVRPDPSPSDTDRIIEAVKASRTVSP